MGLLNKLYTVKVYAENAIYTVEIYVIKKSIDLAKDLNLQFPFNKMKISIAEDL